MKKSLRLPIVEHIKRPGSKAEVTLSKVWKQCFPRISGHQRQRSFLAGISLLSPCGKEQEYEGVSLSRLDILKFTYLVFKV